MTAENWVIIAKIRKAVGVKGEFRAEPLTHDLNRHKRIQNARLQFNSGATLPVIIENSRRSGDFWLLKFLNMDLNSAPAEINNSFLQIPQSERIPPPPDQYYPSDLVGCSILDQHGQVRGTLTEIINTPSVDTLVLKINSAEIFAPWQEQCVLSIDQAAQTITIDFDFLADVYPQLAE